MRMRVINKERIAEWVESVGGIGQATKLVIDATDMMPSTAEKIARGVYPSQPNSLVRKAMCKLTGIPHDELWVSKESSPKEAAS